MNPSPHAPATPDDGQGAMHTLPLTPITAADFAPFGDLIEPMEDGVAFGAHDAQLELAQGTPRFYVMKLPQRRPGFSHITRHTRVTQCLASVGGKPWWIAVAPPLRVDDASAEPALQDIRAFLVPGDVAVKLHRGTWHAGPFFAGESMSFFNLELADTNQVDHHSSDLRRRFGVTLQFGRLPD